MEKRQNPGGLEELTGAIRDATSPSEIHALLFLSWEISVVEIVEAIATHARVWNDALVLALFSTGRVAAIRRLLENPCRPAGIEERVAKWAIARVIGDPSRFVKKDAVGILGPLIENGHFPIEHPIVQEILRLLEEKRKRGLTIDQEAIVQALLKDRNLEPDRLTALYERMRAGSSNDYLLSLIVSHPRTPAELWRRIIREHDPMPRRDLIKACVDREEIRRNPKVRGKLVEEVIGLRSAPLLSRWYRTVTRTIAPSCSSISPNGAYAASPRRRESGAARFPSACRKR